MELLLGVLIGLIAIPLGFLMWLANDKRKTRATRKILRGLQASGFELIQSSELARLLKLEEELQVPAEWNNVRVEAKQWPFD